MLSRSESMIEYIKIPTPITRRWSHKIHVLLFMRVTADYTKRRDGGYSTKEGD